MEVNFMAENNSVFSIFGFYYEQGSIDFPNNHSLIEPFGYNSGNYNPIFKYSINDIITNFIKPATLTSSSILGTTNRMRTIYAESNGNAFIEENKNILTNDWLGLFKILEYLYNNQSTARDTPSAIYNPTTGQGYFSKADEDLSSQNNIYYTPQYVKNSLMLIPSNKLGRLSYVTFRVTINGTYHDIKIYFDADDFVESSDTTKHAVYRYEDIDNDPLRISDSEFNSQIVQKLFLILKKGGYRQYDRVVVDKWINEIINNTPTGNVVQTTETFYVFTSIPESSSAFNQQTKISYIKEYLRNRYDDTYLRFTYRTLFVNDFVEIIPIYNNIINTTTESALLIHPISLYTLRATMNLFGKNFNPDPSSANYNLYRPTEIFYVGGGVDATPQNPPFIYPLIAVESSADSGVSRPISQRFPKFRPMYGIENSDQIDQSSAQFHQYIILALSILNGYILKRSINSDILNAIQLEIIQKSTETFNRPCVDFIYYGVKWRVYGKENTTINED